jgi:hypothetical protein
LQARIEVPTRAHALAREPDGSVLAVARRPGEWLLRWHPQADSVQWHWIDDDYRLNGHVLLGRDGDSLLTTETDLQSGAGLLVRRDRSSLVVTHRWPTQGQDPHAMLYLPHGDVLVANGGIASRPETGRARVPGEPVDASLVAMSDSDGQRRQTWRLADKALSLRHLALHPGGQLAVAMQAHHDDRLLRDRAPVLAVLDSTQQQLVPVAGTGQVAGYGGDVTALGGHWFVSCPRADCVLRVAVTGSASVTRLALADACALAAAADQAWGLAIGRHAGLQLGQAQATPSPLGATPDNHAVVL